MRGRRRKASERRTRGKAVRAWPSTGTFIAAWLFGIGEGFMWNIIDAAIGAIILRVVLSLIRRVV